MAGLGFKDFQVGEVLTSSDVDGYLMQQSVMNFADSAARGSALGTATGTAVPLAEGMLSYLADENSVEVYDGSVWRSVGLFSQIVQTVKTDTFSTTSGSFTPLTGMSVSITPASSSSKILVMVAVNVSASANDRSAVTKLKRDSTDLSIGDAAGSRTRASAQSSPAGSRQAFTQTILYLDSPATTSSVTYSLDIANLASGAGSLAVVNRARDDADASTESRHASSITVVEVPG